MLNDFITLFKTNITNQSTQPNKGGRISHSTMDNNNNNEMTESKIAFKNASLLALVLNTTSWIGIDDPIFSGQMPPAQ